VDLTQPFFARILAHLSEDSLLISTLHTAEDVFSSLAARYNACCDAILPQLCAFFTRVAILFLSMKTLQNVLFLFFFTVFRTKRTLN
jgi:hypothetical protein